MHSFSALRHTRRSSRFKQKTLKGYCVSHVDMCVFSFHAHGDENSVISRRSALTRTNFRKQILALEETYRNEMRKIDTALLQVRPQFDITCVRT